MDQKTDRYTRTLQVALVQFRRDRYDPDDNRRRMDDILESIDGVDIVLLPEAWRGPKLVEMDELEAMLEKWGGIAARGGFTIITGGLFVNTGPAVIDQCHTIGPDGRVIAVTEKIFPSLPVGERSFCSPGDKLPVIKIDGLRFGILICVDLYYPELARSLVLRGADIIFNPANIPDRRVADWRNLLSVRAAENTVYTVFANNTGTTYPDNREVCGGSAAARPFGQLFFTAGDKPEVHKIEIDLASIPKIRARWPYIEDIKSIADFSGDIVPRK